MRNQVASDIHTARRFQLDTELLALPSSLPASAVRVTDARVSQRERRVYGSSNEREKRGPQLCGPGRRRTRLAGVERVLVDTCPADGISSSQPEPH